MCLLCLRGYHTDMDKQTIAAAVGSPNITIEPTGLGISNENLLVTAQDRQYFWRRPKPGAALLATSHDAEIRAMELAADLDVPTLYYDRTTGEKLSRRVQAVTFGESADADRYRRAGQLVAFLHRKPPVETVFDPFEKLEQYRSRTRTPVSFPHEQEILDFARSLWEPLCLCHNDLVCGNILLGQDRDWLIDYEYAAAGDPRFDLAGFLSENSILDPAARAQFLEGYNSSYPEWQIMVFELVADMIWANWAQMLLETHQDPVFAEILRDKQAHFENILNKLVDRKN